ncbi:MAG: 2'-5' RNA ligase family protein [Lachnospiraceae bacterium]|nr:2'-5' RNA ligase family protein [Lachnospiraceae bacterium]
MYLVSIYFDEKTEKWIRKYISDVAKKTNNTFMVNNNVPPHITIAAFETDKVDDVISKMESVKNGIKSGSITWASVATFLPSVIYLAPILNEYLHGLSVNVNNVISSVDGVKLSDKYQPFNWIPHTTIGKKLAKEEMKIAFEVLQNSFGMFDGRVVKIGVAKTNPYEEIFNWELRE